MKANGFIILTSSLHLPGLTSRQYYTSAFGIDYGQPGKYRAQGEQTHLSNPHVIDVLRGSKPSLAHLGKIYFWVKSNFETWSAGGSTIGAVTVDQLFAERKLGGCHDWGLVYACIARELGYPAVMADTMGIAWALSFRAGQAGGYVGHVFVEVFVKGKWVLVDSTNGWFVADDYDPTNPVIPLKTDAEKDGNFVMRKGVDTWGYGIHSNAELLQLMENSARGLRLEKLKVPSYNFQRFVRECCQ